MFIREYDLIFGDDDDFFEEETPEEENFDCGFIPGEGCQLAGTEDCDFNCPYHDAVLYAVLCNQGNRLKGTNELPISEAE